MRSPKRMRCISVMILSYFGISLGNPSLSAINVPPPFPFPAFPLPFFRFPFFPYLFGHFGAVVGGFPLCPRSQRGVDMNGGTIWSLHLSKLQ